MGNTREVFLGLVLLGTPLVTAKSQTPARDNTRRPDLLRVAAADVSRPGIGALTLEPPGAVIPTDPLAYVRFLSGTQMPGSVAVDGGTLLGRTDCLAQSSEGSFLRSNADSRAAFDPDGKSSHLFDSKDAGYTEDDFEAVVFGIATIILSGFLLAVRALLRGGLLVRFGRLLRSTAARRRVERAPAVPVFEDMVGQHAE